MRAPVEFLADRDFLLRGEAIFGGPMWVVLAHDQGEDVASWGDLPERVAAVGVTAVAFDLRGHGASDGEIDAAATADDLEAVLGSVRDRGATAIVIVASGTTATIAANCSTADAVAAIAPTPSSTEPAANRPRARLVIASRDAAVQTATAALQDQPGRRTMVANVPASGVGLELLAGAWASNVASYVVTYVHSLQRELSSRRSGQLPTVAGARQ